MHSFSLFAKAPDHPYSNATLYKEFIDEILPIKARRNLTLTYVALSAIFYNRKIPKCALEGCFGKRVQFFQETFSKGSEAFKKILRQEIWKKKQEIEHLTPTSKKFYLEKHFEMDVLPLLNSSISATTNEKNLFYVFKTILPLRTSLSLDEKLKYSLSIESLTSKTMSQSQISTLISIIQNINFNDYESDSDSDSSSDDDFDLKEKLQFIAFAKLLIKNRPDDSKIDIIKHSSKIHPRERSQLLALIQSPSFSSPKKHSDTGSNHKKHVITHLKQKINLLQQQKTSHILHTTGKKVTTKEIEALKRTLDSLPPIEMSQTDKVKVLIYILSRLSSFHCATSSIQASLDILSLITPDMKQSHIDIIISELACIPSSERPFISRFVKSLIASKTLDLTCVIKLSHFLIKYTYFPSPKSSRYCQVTEIIFLFTTYSPGERSILLDLITSLLKKTITDLSGISSILSRDSKTLESYNPTYITNRDPLTFNHQEDYLRRTREVITIGAKVINNAHSADKKLLFFTLLDYFSKERGHIAKDHKTDKAEKFGVRRDFNKSKETITAFTTPLSSIRYQEYGRKLLDFLKPQISEIIKSPFKDITYEFKEQILGCQSILQIELLDRQNVQELCSKKPAFYRSLSLNKKIYNIQWVLSKITNTPSKDSKAFLVEFSVSIEIKKRHLLTQYYTWVSKDPSNSNDLHFSNVIALHQDHSLIEETLDEAAQIFKQIMNFEGEDLSCFQEKLALLTYILAHNARDHRGSAAETEWLVHAICLANNLHISEDPNRLQDLEAFSNPLLADYIAAHKDMIKLSRK